MNLFRSFRFLTALTLLAFSTLAHAGANIVIINNNAPGVGFNDPTPTAPIGGNSGTTIGQQRLIAFQYAANIWGATLDSNTDIRVQAQFVPLTCTATAAVLGSAGTIQIIRDFPGAEFPATWYHTALANKRAGTDLLQTNDINTNFNSNLGNPGCLTASGWYYGLDTNHPSNRINLVTVLLHEFAHGLGFSQFASTSSGSQIQGLTDVYGRRLFDLSQNRFWPDMTNAQRAASAINSRRVVWTGPTVTASASSVLSYGIPLLRISAPAAIAGAYPVGLAAFGTQLSPAVVAGDLVVATDDANAGGPSTTDGCTAITNAGAVAGRIAVVDRGTCGFVIKAKNVQNAGAIAMVVADNVAGGPPAGMAGVDPTVTIPSVRITLADANAIKAQLGGNTVTGALTVDLSVLAGGDDAGRVLVNAPNPVQPGSSISHWDPVTNRNQLMEPAINFNLTHSVKPPEDLTLPLFRDIGWYPDADLDFVPDDNGDVCLASDLRPTVNIGGTDTGVPNTFYTNGCTIADLVNKCAVDARNHGDFVSCVAGLTNVLKEDGVDKSALQRAAAKARIP